MIWGRITLFCPICGARFLYDGNSASGICHTKDFGYVCSQACHKASQAKYARMILGHDDPAEEAR